MTSSILGTAGEVVAPQANKERGVLISVVIPAYNEAANIERIINDVRQYTDLIIVIDDGSADDTGGLAKSLGATVVRHTRNKGKGFALKTGLIESLNHNPDIIVTIDADGQHDPSEIPRLVEPILRGECDIVVGSRFLEGMVNEVPSLRAFGLSMIHLTSKLLIRSSVRDNQSGFRAYGKKVFDLISQYGSSGFGAETEQLAIAESHGFKIIEVPVSIRYIGLKNTSKLNPFIHGSTIMSTIVRIAARRKPLHIIGIPGLVFVCAALITMTELLLLFNETRYFSVPLAIITLGFFLVGLVLVLMAMVFQELKSIRQSHGEP